MLDFTMVKLEIYIPVMYLELLREALRSAGAGAFGNYDSALSYSPVKGCWRPLPGASPYDGEIGVLCFNHKRALHSQARFLCSQLFPHQ